MKRRLSTVPIGALAVGGVVAGHALAYLLAVPEGHERNVLLTHAGHGYWSYALSAGMALGLAAAAVLIGRWARPSSTPSRGGVLGLAARLIALQSVLFVALEVSERAVAGQPLGTLMQHHLLTIGLVAQLFVAASIAVVMRLLAGAVRMLIAQTRPAAARAATPAITRGQDVLPRRFVLSGATGVRGPPSLGY